jgi:hypothetical protein
LVVFSGDSGGVRFPARLQTVRKEQETLAARRQARAEAESLRKRLEQVPEYHIPSAYRAAPWLLAGAVVVLTLTVIFVAVLMLGGK